MATHAACVTERARLMGGGRSGIAAFTIFDIVEGSVLLVKDSRIEGENEAKTTDSFQVSSWNRYDVGDDATYPDSEVTFA